MDSDLYFDGKRYISAKRAAQLSGYSSDYVGQLSRANKINSRLIGKTRYVCFDDFASYAKLDTHTKPQQNNSDISLAPVYAFSQKMTAPVYKHYPTILSHLSDSAKNHKSFIYDYILKRFLVGSFIFFLSFSFGSAYASELSSKYITLGAHTYNAFKKTQRSIVGIAGLTDVRLANALSAVQVGASDVSQNLSRIHLVNSGYVQNIPDYIPDSFQRCIDAGSEVVLETYYAFRDITDFYADALVSKEIPLGYMVNDISLSALNALPNGASAITSLSPQEVTNIYLGIGEKIFITLRDVLDTVVVGEMGAGEQLARILDVTYILTTIPEIHTLTYTIPYISLNNNVPNLVSKKPNSVMPIIKNNNILGSTISRINATKELNTENNFIGFDDVASSNISGGLEQMSVRVYNFLQPTLLKTVGFLEDIKHSITKLSQAGASILSESALNTTHQISDIFAGRVHTKVICVGTSDNETCITQAQLDELLHRASQVK